MKGDQLKSVILLLCMILLIFLVYASGIVRVGRPRILTIEDLDKNAIAELERT